MTLVRAIVVALTALSVALLPVAGAHAWAATVQTSHFAATPDCCQHCQHCDHQSKDRCGDAECFVKCSGVSTAPLENPGAAFAQLVPDKTARMGGIAKTQAPNPPSPPPRA